MLNKSQEMAGIRKLERVQFVLISILALATLAIFGGKVAASVILGGFVALIPSLLFARKLFQYQGARAAKKILQSFYLGEAIKLVISMLLFALVFIFLRINAPAFFLTYIAVIMTHWLSPLFIMH